MRRGYPGAYKRKRLASTDDEGYETSETSVSNKKACIDTKKEDPVSALLPGHGIRPTTLQDLQRVPAPPEDCSESMFESLEVAVRLDIGASSKAEGFRFFVDEITREWHADMASYVTGYPQTRLCAATANARGNSVFS